MHWFQAAGETWSWDDYTLLEMAEVEEKLDERWCDVMPGGRVRHLLVLLAVYLGRTRKEGEVADIIAGLTMEALDATVSYEAGDDMPTAWRDGIPLTDAPATNGSSGATEPADGTPLALEPSLSAT